MFVRGKPES